MWTQEDGLEAAKMVAQFAQAEGWNISLTGGVLMRGGSDHDLDLVATPRQKGKVSMPRSLDGLRGLKVPGLVFVQDRTSWDAGICLQFAYEDKRLDIIVPNVEPVKDWRKVVEFDERGRGVAIAVQHHGSKNYLACMRTKCRDMNGLVQFPGGAVEPGETLAEAASRELWEETGMHYGWQCFHPLGSALGSNEAGVPLLTTGFYLCVHGEVFAAHKEPDKHGPWDWLSKEELIKLPVMPLAAHFLGRLK